MPRPWTVLPHQPIEKLSDNLWAVEGSLGRGGMKRRMAISRLSDGRLVFMNAVPLDDESMRAIEAWGTPSFVVVPNGFHRLDLQPFQARYPKIEFLTGPKSQRRVGQMVPVAGGWERLPKGIGLQVIPVAGSSVDEPWLLSRSGSSSEVADLCMPGDSVMNVAHFGGVQGFIMKLIGTTGGPRVTGIAKLMFVKDKAALRRQLEELATLAGLRLLVPCHGHIAADASLALREAAATV
jgi:hypothetical protein